MGEMSPKARGAAPSILPPFRTDPGRKTLNQSDRWRFTSYDGRERVSYSGRLSSRHRMTSQHGGLNVHVTYISALTSYADSRREL